MDINNGIIDSANTWITGPAVTADEEMTLDNASFHMQIKAKSLFGDEPMQKLSFTLDLPPGFDTSEEAIAWGENQVLQAIVDAINNQEYKKGDADGPNS